MKKNIKILFSILFIFVFLLILNSSVYAATTSLTAKSTKVNVGDTITVTASVTAAQWDLSILVNGQSIAISNELDNYQSNITKSFSGTYKAASEGTITFTLSGDITDVDQTNTPVNQTLEVTVTKKTTSDGNSGNNSGGNTTKPSTPTTTAPKFTSVNETVYATDDGINVRKSYSTSSKALGILKKGESIKRTGIATTKTSDGITWSKVTYNGQIAYVSSAYLTKTKPAEDKPKTEEPKENTTSNEEVNNTTSEENNEATNNEVDNNNTVENTTTTDGSLGLSSLEIAGVNFSDGFDPNKHSYGLKLNFYVKSLDITTKANKEGAKIEIIGNHDFVEGENNVTILLTSADGSETATYQIKVTVPSEVATAPQNNIQFYLTCGSAIVIAIIVIAIITAIYKKVSNGSKKDKDEYKTNEENNIEDPYTELKPKKERSKGKHSN